jgi:hypothetical protein
MAANQPLAPRHGVSDAGTTHDSTLYIVASTGWVPPVTVSSPSRTGSLQAAQTVSGGNSAPQVCWKMTGSAPGLTYRSPIL